MVDTNKYIEDVKKMIVMSLNVEYDETVKNKEDLEINTRKILTVLADSPQTFDAIAKRISEWSFYQAKKHHLAQTQQMAKCFLSLFAVRNYTVQCVNLLEKEIDKKFGEKGQTK